MTLFHGQASPARRGFLAGLAAVVVAAGGTAWKFGLARKHYPATPYDDLLTQIVDREPAAKLGAMATRSMPGVISVAALAARLRQPGAELARRAPLDCTQGLVSEVGGWVVPQSVALYAVLAARV